MQSHQATDQGAKGGAATVAIAAAADDRRWKLVNATMRRHGHSAQALIETLHTVQEAYGFLDDDSLKMVAQALGVPLSKVYGVATFYHFFTLKPQGEHTCVVCMGTACYIKGSPELLAGVHDVAGINCGETTEDGKVSLLSARCLGSCGLAPAIVMDGQVVGRLSGDDMKARIQIWMDTPAAEVANA